MVMKKIALKIMTMLAITNMAASFATAPEQISFWKKVADAALPTLQKTRSLAHGGLEKLRDNWALASLVAIWGITQTWLIKDYFKKYRDSHDTIKQLEKDAEKADQQEKQEALKAAQQKRDREEKQKEEYSKREKERQKREESYFSRKYTTIRDYEQEEKLIGELLRIVPHSRFRSESERRLDFLQKNKDVFIADMKRLEKERDEVEGKWRKVNELLKNIDNFEQLHKQIAQGLKKGSLDDSAPVISSQNTFKPRDKQGLEKEREELRKRYLELDKKIKAKSVNPREKLVQEDGLVQEVEENAVEEHYDLASGEQSEKMKCEQKIINEQQDIKQQFRNLWVRSLGVLGIAGILAFSGFGLSKLSGYLASRV